MICEKCNKNIDDDSKFCSFCGHKIEKNREEVEIYKSEENIYNNIDKSNNEISEKSMSFYDFYLVFSEYVVVFIYFCLSLFFFYAMTKGILDSINYSWYTLKYVISNTALLSNLFFENLFSLILSVLFFLMTLRVIKKIKHKK